MKRISWNIDEVFPHLQKGSCDRCKECKQEISWLWMCPTWQTITVAFWSFLQFSIINVKLTFSDARLRFIYVLEAAPIITLSSRAVTVTRSSLHVISVTLGKEPEFSTWRSIERWTRELTGTLTTMSFICIKHGESSVLCNGTRYDLPEEALNYKDSIFWVYLGVYIALVLFAGLYEGTSDFLCFKTKNALFSRRSTP